MIIAQISPFPWEDEHPLNHYVRQLSLQLSKRGHQVTILAPSHSESLIRESRSAIRNARTQSETLLGGAEPRLLAVGEVMPFAKGILRKGQSFPLDVARTVEEVMQLVPFDIVHVHEPYAPSTSSAALRNSRALNVGSFHTPYERIIATSVVRRLQALLFGRLDARTVSYRATSKLLETAYPAHYDLITPGVDSLPLEKRNNQPPTILFLDAEERAASRLFIRALRQLDTNNPWQVEILDSYGTLTSTRIRRNIQERITINDPTDSEQSLSEQQTMALSQATIVVFASNGMASAPHLLLAALAYGAIPVAARIPTYDELLDEGTYGLLFEPGDGLTLAQQLERLISQPVFRTNLLSKSQHLQAQLRWERVADDFESVYSRLIARRHRPPITEALKTRLAKRQLIDVDLHMHTNHSYDCATPVETLLESAKQVGLGAIAITDHNEISGAHEAAAQAQGIKVIVAEEIKTATQGEVIGLFIKEKIPRGMTLSETIAAIKAQGGLVYVPHPFDRLHSVPDYKYLVDIVEEIDAVEVFNARVAVKEFNEEALRFAEKYRIPAGAGSDAHVPQGLGSVRIRMRDFDGPEEFLASLSDADIIRKPANLFYVQA